MITKRDLIRLRQCRKLHWISKREPELVTVSASGLWRMQQGEEVGRRAREEYPDGLLVGASSSDLDRLLHETRDTLASEPDVLFEGGFHHDGLVVRPDILERGPTDWRLIEVKGNTIGAGKALDAGTQAEHDLDLAVQLFVLERVGLVVERCELMLLNRAHRHPDVEGLFRREDRSAAARALQATIPDLIARARDLDRDAPPAVSLGPHCRSGRETCALLPRCRKEAGLDRPGSVFELYSGGQAIWDAIDQGLTDLVEIPYTSLRPMQLRQKQVLRSGTRYVDRDALAAGLVNWDLPLLYLDFETVNFALPRHEGDAPWQQVPFQYSLHVEHAPGKEPEHFEFLHVETSDPRPPLAESLAALLARWPESPIVAWYASFERGRLQELADRHPEHAEILNSAAGRLVDPRPLVIEAIYDAGFFGSFSLKEVAPALLGKQASYADLQVKDGSAAIAAWATMIGSGDENEREQLRQALLAYCKQDTRVMVDLVRHLRWMAIEG